MREYNNKIIARKFSAIFWPIVVLFYLSTSIMTNSWSQSWLIWPIAGIIYAVFAYSHDPVNE